MSLTGSLFSGVSGLNSQGSVLGIIGDNIANISTVGFKSGNATFASIVAGNVTQSGGSGATASNRLAVDQQGQIQSTGIATDIAISGQGFFVVKNDTTEGQGDYLYTRAGSFRQDELGFFVNSSGYVLQGWPLDNEGRLPGEVGNLNTTSSQLLESLDSVNTRDISGLAFATTSIALGLNLDADESILAGSGATIKPVSTLNDGVASDEILAETAGEIEEGDILTIDLGNGSTFDFEYGGWARSDNITVNNIFSAATSAQRFTLNNNPGNPGHLQEGDAFTITTATTGTVTFTFNEFNPNADLRTFNSLDTMAAAIDAVPGLNARVSGGRLYVSPTDARIAMTLADVGTAEIVSSLTANDTEFDSTVNTANNRFNTLDGLAALVGELDGISASIESPANDASLSLNADDPLQTIQFTDDGANNGVLLTEFGLPSGVQDPVYDATGVNGSNMASGDIAPAFTRNVRIFDSLGTGHDLRLSFAKAANNEWLVEVYVANEDEIITTAPNGQIASGTIIFNGDGSLRNVSSSLTNDIEVIWANDSSASTISLNLGTAGSPAGTVGATAIGQTDGLSQFSGAYNVQFVEQNGAGSGLLSSLEINDEGFVIANFSNGQSRNVFKVPLASFPNPNGLVPQSGNVFASSDASGEFSLNEAGGSGVGVIAVAALESANTELADELTKLIVAQRAFQANTKIITTADELLEELNRI